MIEGGSKVSAQSSLSDKCSLMCSLADSSFTLMMNQIFDGSVTFIDMEFILEKQVEVERLCADRDDYKLDEVRSFLRCRKFECTAFRDYKTRLDSFCSKLNLSRVQITGELFCGATKLQIVYCMCVGMCVCLFFFRFVRFIRRN